MEATFPRLSLNHVCKLSRISGIPTRGPTRVPRKFGVVGDIDELIARAFGLNFVLQTYAGEFRDRIHQLQQRGCIPGSAADVVDLPASGGRTFVNGFECVQKIFHVQHIPHLQAASVDDQRSPQ